MKLLVGLGNPGEKYKKNRHNIGYRFVDFLRSSRWPSGRSQFLKTDCFMNDSGKFVRREIEKMGAQADSLYVVHDDLDLTFGQFKIQLGVGPKIHNGVISVEQELGTKNFWRVRIGVDNRPTSPKASRANGEKYVLENFTQEEEEKLPEIFQKIYETLIDNFSGH